MYECALVGGGIHGTYLVQRLLEETSLERSDLVIVDPRERLLESFRRKAHACEMAELRSTFVHHVGTEPFGLESFAESRGREDELRPTPGYPRRPSLSLFLDYADYVIETHDLESLHRRAGVTAIAERAGGLELETTRGTIGARRCVLAVGQGRPHRPAWAHGLERVTHVFDEGFDADAGGRTVVVGGGITAAQVATCLASRADEVTLCHRRPLERELVEADPRWINWKHIERHLHGHPPGARARYEVICEARNDATVPPYLHDDLEACADAGTLSVRRGEVADARAVDGEVRLLLAGGGCLLADRVVLATGFDPVADHPFVERVAGALGLERGYRGLAVLDDETLAWRHTDGRSSRVFATGALAASSVGPLAGTIAGARRSADRITEALETATSARSSGTRALETRAR
ncbi:FAD/NAD(P)-binding protein [Natronobiforma cellulositropha]|uniref:FAD/NAD(P)-binding protein n=1 Tax=Natronobiforma cellulositropha TaxID=1679076 RepID=UPI0021D60757|nr:FAD/NAD(P)-binding protein [Natronobiforma cellulositropha]